MKATGYLLLVSLVALVGLSHQTKVKLTVYYESLCPDSRRFIINQLYPLLTELGGPDNDYLQPEFIPYGKANTSFVGGQYGFTCQHGPSECYGNQYHACALAKLSKQESADFINCMMTSFNAPFDAEICANETKVDFNVLETCYNSWEGPTLLAANGIKTHDLNPTLYYVPWITYNDVWTVEGMTGSETNLLKTLCEKLQPGPLPPQCGNATLVGV